MSEDPKPWFPLRTDRLALREFREADLADVHAYAAIPEVSRFMTWGPNSEAESRAFLDRALASQAEWLHREGFLESPVDLDAFIAPEPLEAAKALLAAGPAGLAGAVSA